jgi:hypothetical protein
VTCVGDELDAMAAAMRGIDLVEIVVDSWRAGRIELGWALCLIAEAGRLAELAAGREWPWFDERAASSADAA